ncbi:MAG: hypothetical protein M3O00_07450 [Pseudomonadota bacterium]|nr:hypothetical protein [Pseudomonadota bacterium]
MAEPLIRVFSAAFAARPILPTRRMRPTRLLLASVVQSEESNPSITPFLTAVLRSWRAELHPDSAGHRLFP